MAKATGNLLPLAAEQLYKRVSPGELKFETTAELQPLSELIGQERAVEAVRFGIGMRSHGYNLYALGPPGLGKHTMVRRCLERESASAPTPSDWCYVYNFDEPGKPRALKLPPGRGVRLRAAMQAFSDELTGAITATFESDEYRTRLEQLNEEFSERETKALRELGEEAEKQGVALLRTPAGFALAPAVNGEVIKSEDYEKLPPPERERITGVIESLYEKLHKIMHELPKWGKEQRERIRQLNREFTTYAVGHLVDELKERHKDLPEVLTHLDAVRTDVIDNADEFRRPAEAPGEGMFMPDRQLPVKRYLVNVVVDHGNTRGAPVVFEDHPTLGNLIGRVEHLARFGALVTDYTLIKPGALHRANGGYLMIDAYKMLMEPYAWEALKRAISAREIRINSLGQALSLISTVSLEPQSILLDVKVVLFGERRLYYLLYQFDPEFRELFKVAADFEDEIVRDAEAQQMYARLIATIAADEKLLPFDRSGVARAIEHSARLAGDVEKLSAHMQQLTDLLRASDYWARQAGRVAVSAADVVHTIDTQVRRADRMRERMLEEILRGTLLIDTSGARVGQVNGLAVLDIGDFAFGMPTRITATARLGDGHVVDIQREVELGGAIHSKGVLILASYLAARYAADQPLSLSASLVFEQTYGQVEGDSASTAELCALLSSLSGVPLDQRLAITGSVNQHGEVQAIGGVNEKIEGFFDLCKARGLNGNGVVIPAANVKHLMLRHDVVQAVSDGSFRVYAVAHVDHAIELLSGIPAGTTDTGGAFAAGSINARVAARLKQFTDRRRAFAVAPSGARGRKR